MGIYHSSRRPRGSSSRSLSAWQATAQLVPLVLSHVSLTFDRPYSAVRLRLRAQLEKLIRLNHSRADFAEKFEKLIESYNQSSQSIGELFEELLKLNRNLSDEQQRHVRENMTEEELVIFDILSADERAEVKKVSRELLNKLKMLLVLNWRQKSTARSQLKLTIEDVLDKGLPRTYTLELYRQKCSALFEHVYESYLERDAGVYTTQSSH